MKRIYILPPMLLAMMLIVPTLWQEALALEGRGQHMPQHRSAPQRVSQPTWCSTGPCPVRPIGSR